MGLEDAAELTVEFEERSKRIEMMLLGTGLGTGHDTPGPEIWEGPIKASESVARGQAAAAGSASSRRYRRSTVGGGSPAVSTCLRFCVAGVLQTRGPTLADSPLIANRGEKT